MYIETSNLLKTPKNPNGNYDRYFHQFFLKKPIIIGKLPVQKGNPKKNRSAVQYSGKIYSRTQSISEIVCAYFV
jgi:hypothetical protein